MLTNTAPADPQDHSATITATSIAVDAAERHRRTAMREIGQLAEDGTITASEAAELEADAGARCTALIRALELCGEEIVDPRLWAEYEARASRRRADRRRSPVLRGLNARTRALRERQMCVVATARVNRDVLSRLGRDDDDEAVAVRDDLAATGLL